MRKLSFAMASAGLLAFLLAGPIAAQEGNAPAQPMDQGGLSQISNDLLNKDLKTSDGESIGNIHDLVLDPASGKIRYVVVSHGGALDVRNDLVVIPWTLVDVTPAGDLVVSVNKDQLAQAPSYSQGQEPNWNDANYQANIIAFYEDPLRQAAEDQRIDFSALDVNNDGSVTADELQRASQDIQQIDQQFSQIDNDNSGDITQSEFAQFEAKPPSDSGMMDSGGSR